MSAVNKVLDRLQRVKQTRPNAYIAGCPCCQSRRGRPIKVDERDDGRILVFAFCGCATSDVLQAIGLSLADLFEAPLPGTHNYKQYLAPVGGGFNARELLELVHHELTVAAMLLTAAEERPLNFPEMTRLRQATARVGKAQGFINGH